MKRLARLAASLLFLFSAVSCGDKGITGPTVPNGTNLAGTWLSNMITERDPNGGQVGFRIRFKVDASSRTASDFVMVGNATDVGRNVVSGSATIENGRFRFDQTAEGSCNGLRNRMMVEIGFQTANSGSGRYEVTNPGPGAFICAGSSSGNITVTR